MARRSLPRLCPTLVVDVDDEGSVDDKDGDKDANSSLALTVAGEGVGRQDGDLGGETGRGGLALLFSTETLFSPFDTGQNLAYSDPDRKLANVPQSGRR